MKSLYSVTTSDLVSFRVRKFDEDFNFVTDYTVLKSRPRWICNCQHGTRSNTPCRHMSIVKIFDENKRLNSGYFLDFDIYGLDRAWIKLRTT